MANSSDSGVVVNAYTDIDGLLHKGWTKLCDYNPKKAGMSSGSWGLSEDKSEYFNYNALTFDYYIQYPTNFSGGSSYVGIVCSQTANGKDRRISEIVNGPGTGSGSFALKNIDGSSASVNGFISVSGKDIVETDENIIIMIGNVKATWTYDWNVFSGDASLSMIGDGCSTAYNALKYCGNMCVPKCQQYDADPITGQLTCSKYSACGCGEWVSLGQGNNISLYKDPSTNKYAITYFSMACGATSPLTYGSISANSAMDPSGEIKIPTGCGKTVCARASKTRGTLYYGVAGYSLDYDANPHVWKPATRLRLDANGNVVSEVWMKYFECEPGKSTKTCFGYPDSDGYSGITEPQEMGPIIEMTYDIHINNAQKSIGCGNCVSVQNGPAWAPPDSCYEKDEKGNNKKVNYQINVDYDGDDDTSSGVNASFNSGVVQ